MGVIDRIILTVYTFSLAIISFATVLAALGLVAPAEWVLSHLERPGGRWVVGLLGAAFLAVSVRLIFFAFYRRRAGQALVHETELGDVRISLDAVENLVKKVARSVKGVREVKASVQSETAGLSTELRCVFSPDVSIPEVSQQIQDEVRTYVRRVVGVDVAVVRVHVENIVADRRGTRLD